MKLLLCTVLLCLLGWPVWATTRYASPSGSGSTCSLGSPCDLQTALTASVAGDTLYLRGGVFIGKFTLANSGTSVSRISVLAYPGEFPKIDGNKTTTLTAPLSAVASGTQQSISVASTAGIVVAQDATFTDGTPGTDELVHVQAVTNSTTMTVVRGWSSTTPVSHLSGATVLLAGTQLTVTGSYLTFQNFEIYNSDTTRSQVDPNSQTGPHDRGPCIDNNGASNEFINLTLHDCENGLLNDPGGAGVLLYGLVVYNNGYFAAGAQHGHGIYFIHTSASLIGTAKDCVIFNNANNGIKADSQNNDTRNIRVEGCAIFNNGSWLQNSTRTWNLLLASNNGIARDVWVINNIFFHSVGMNGTSVQLGNTGALNGPADVEGNYFLNGIPILSQYWTPLTFSTNTISATNNTGGGNSIVVQYAPAAGPTPTVTWNNNTYWNQISSGRGFSYPGAGGVSFTTFPLWKSNTGFDSGSTQTQTAPTADWVVVRPNVYSPGYGNIYVAKNTAGTSVSVDVSSLGLLTGQSATIYAAEDLTASVATISSYAGANVTVPVNGTTVTQPIGWVTTTIATVRPAFQAFVLIPGAQPAGPPDAPTSLSASLGTSAGVTLSYTIPASGAAATGVTVGRSTDGVTYSTLTTSAPFTAGAQTYTDSTVAAKAFYYYRISSQNGSGSSVNVGPVTSWTPVVNCYSTTCPR